MKSNNSKNGLSLNSFITGGLIILVIWFLFILFVNYVFDAPYNELAARFGDSFGGLNALFSGLAFAGIIYTILLQRKELQLQREELQETRQELKRSADAQEKSEKAFNRQIDIMAKTAVINSYSTIIDFKGVQYRTTKSASFMEEQRKEAYRLMEELTKITNDLIKDSNSHSKSE